LTYFEYFKECKYSDLGELLKGVYKFRDLKVEELSGN